MKRFSAAVLTVTLALTLASCHTGGDDETPPADVTTHNSDESYEDTSGGFGLQYGTKGPEYGLEIGGGWYVDGSGDLGYDVGSGLGDW